MDRTNLAICIARDQQAFKKGLDGFFIGILYRMNGRDVIMDFWSSLYDNSHRLVSVLWQSGRRSAKRTQYQRQSTLQV